MTRLVLLGIVAVTPAIAALSTLTPVLLRCEYQENPLAIDAAQPRLSWIVRATDPPQRGLRQTAYEILVAASKDALAKDSGDVWITGKVASAETAHIPYRGKTLVSGGRYFWKVRVWDGSGVPSGWSDTAQWSMGLLRTQDWRATWIAREPDGEKSVDPIMPIFRRSFRVDKPVLRAVLYISGLGQYEARVNGTKLGDAVLMPGWTNYRKTVFYNTYDITSELTRGENAVGVMLGNGMYNVVKTPGRYTKFSGSFGQPKLIAQLHVTFNDGSSFELLSDRSWKSRAGPVVYSSTYGGEDFDARREPEGWDRAGYDDANWSAALEVGGPGGKLTSQTNPDIKLAAAFKAARVTEPKPGIRIYDLGQNISGWPKITVRGPAGASVKLIGGELLDADGFVSQRSAGAGDNRRGRQWYSYTLKGLVAETWQPRFSYYGFRYVQVETTGTPEILDLEGQFIHSSSPVVGEFTCSRTLFNDVHRLINNAILSNMQSVLSDCPHREKLGWLEETHLLGSAVMYNYDVRRLYSKISDDIRDAQLQDGLVPEIAPEYVVFDPPFRDSPEWASATVINPWLIYQHYGDRQLLTTNYDVMKRYVEYLGTKAQNHLLSHGLGDWYDIGPKPPGPSQLTSLAVTATAIYYADLVILQKAAALLDRNEDAKRFGALAREVRQAFNTNLYNPQTGVYDRGSQTAFAMPLVLGLIVEENRNSVVEKLVATVRQNRNTVTAGDIGFHYVVRALSDAGRSDVLYDMLSRADGPSYGYQLQQGATTLTEAWDANPASSQNHFMLGHAEEWLYRGLAGLDLDFTRPRVQQIRIRPAIVGDITAVSASHNSVVGQIAVAWRIDNGTIRLNVTVPPNTTAEVSVPTSAPQTVLERGRPAKRAQGVQFLASRRGAAVYQVESGEYEFSARLRNTLEVVPLRVLP